MTIATTKKGKLKGKGACPTFLFARWREISRGGSQGYKLFGFSIMEVVSKLEPHADTEDAWCDKLAALAEMVDQIDDAGILAWFDQEVPRLMCLVPKRRRDLLVEGMYDAVKATDGECLSL